MLPQMWKAKLSRESRWGQTESLYGRSKLASSRRIGGPQNKLNNGEENSNRQPSEREDDVAERPKTTNGVCLRVSGPQTQLSSKQIWATWRFAYSPSTRASG